MGPKAMHTLRSALQAKGLEPAAGQPTPTKAARRNRAGGVGEFLEALEHPRKAEIEVLRSLILATDSRVQEEIKWNAPSFFITEHFATFKLQPVETVQLVLHTGAKVRPEARAIDIDDPAGLLTWAAKDRCIATFTDMNDVETKRSAFTSIIQQWISACFTTRQ